MCRLGASALASPHIAARTLYTSAKTASTHIAPEMVAQDHFDVLTDSGTESDGGGGGRYKRGVGPGSAIGMRAAELAPAARDTGSTRSAGDLAAVGSKPHTPSLNEGSGTAFPATQRQNVGATAARYEHENPAYPGNSRHATDSGAAAAAVSAAEITSDSDESDADDTSPAGRGVPQPSSSRKKKSRRSGGVFPAAKGFSGYNPDDYEQKYPPDNHVLEAMGPNARIWRVYLDEATLRDSDVIEGWRDTTDVLLVFAGLFSAVVTTLVVQSSQSLQPDNSQATVTLLSELIDVQRAVGLGMSPDTVPRSQQPSAMGPASSDLWVNGLWFVSLALSLATALMAMLVKQWIQYYIHPVAGTIPKRAHIAHLRFLGLETWHVPAIIEFLPIVMHLALLLFFIGLVIFIKGLDNGITIWVAIIVGPSYLIYLGTNLLPFYDINCPYKTPMGDYSMKLGLFVWRHGQKLRVYLKNLFIYIYKPMLAVDLDKRSTTSVSENKVLKNQSIATMSWRVLEQKSIWPSDEYKLDIESLFWLYSYSANPTVSNLILQALPGANFKHDLTMFIETENVHDTIKNNLEKYCIQKDQRQTEKWLWPWTIVHMTQSSSHFLKWCHDNPIQNYKIDLSNKQLKGFFDCFDFVENTYKISQCISSLKLQVSPSTFDLYITLITFYLKKKIFNKKYFYEAEIGFIYLCNLTGLTTPNTLKEDDTFKFNIPESIDTRENLTLLKSCANLMFLNEQESHIYTNFDNAKNIVQVHSILCKVLSRYLSEPNFTYHFNPHYKQVFFNLCAYGCEHFRFDIDVPSLIQMFPSQFISFVRNIESVRVPAWWTCGMILRSSILALSSFTITCEIHQTPFEKLFDNKFIQSWFYIFKQAIQQNPKLRTLDNLLYYDCLSHLLSYIFDVSLHNTELMSVLCSLDIDILGRILPFSQIDTTNEYFLSTYHLYYLYANLKKIYDTILFFANYDCLQEELKYIQKNDNVQLYCKLFMALWKHHINCNELEDALTDFGDCIVKFISITSENPIWIEFLEQLKDSIEEGIFSESEAWFSNDVCVWFNKLRHAANLESKISDMNVECSGKLMFIEAKHYYVEKWAWIHEMKQFYQTSSHKNEVVPAKRPNGIFRKYFRITMQPDAESQT